MTVFGSQGYCYLTIKGVPPNIFLYVFICLFDLHLEKNKHYQDTFAISRSQTVKLPQ